MNCWSIFTYYDYEEAYYHLQYYKCKEIGIYILSKQSDRYSRELLEGLKKINCDWDCISKKDLELLWEIKVWLMVNVNYF